MSEAPSRKVFNSQNKTVNFCTDFIGREFPYFLQESKVIPLPKPEKYSKFPQNVKPSRPLARYLKA
jgi:hypothetical protein